MMSDKYIKYFPNSKLKISNNTKTNYQTILGGGRFVTSTGSNMLGVHCDLIIGDDLQNLNTIYSEAERNSTNSWVSNTLSTRKTDKEISLTIYVQQRLHSLDLTSYLLSLPVKYKHIVLPAELNELVKDEYVRSKYIDGKLDVNRLNDNSLKLSKGYLGSKNYKIQFNQLVFDDQSSIIKKFWFNIFEELDNKREYLYFIDTAYGEKNSDYSAILECYIDNNNLYVTNTLKVNLPFPELIKQIKTFCVKGKRLFIEGKASGKSIIQQLKSSTKYIIEEVKSTDGKIVRLNAISPTVESGKVHLYKGYWNEEFLDEVCTNYPDNDDLRDTFVFAVEYLLEKEDYGVYNIN